MWLTFQREARQTKRSYVTRHLDTKTLYTFGCGFAQDLIVCHDGNRRSETPGLVCPAGIVLSLEIKNCLPIQTTDQTSDTEELGAAGEQQGGSTDHKVDQGSNPPLLR